MRNCRAGYLPAIKGAQKAVDPATKATSGNCTLSRCYPPLASVSMPKAMSDDSLVLLVAWTAETGRCLLFKCRIFFLVFLALVASSATPVDAESKCGLRGFAIMPLASRDSR